MFVSTAHKRLVLALIIVAVLTGIWARAYRLDRKLFWQDEAVAALHVSGHNLADVRRFFDGRVHTRAEIATLLERDPHTSVATALGNLSSEDAHLSPLFYIIDRLTLDAVGGGAPSTYRLPSVIAGIVSIGFAFALGTALLRSRLGGGMLAALVAVSPFQILYARQTREYALFATLVFASSFFLLRALERRNAATWAAYGVSVALGLYADSLFALVMAAHAIVAVATLRGRAKQLAVYAAATLAGALTFAPWALHGLRARSTVAGEISWAATGYPIKFFVEKWAFNVGAVFFDSEFGNLRLGAVAGLVLLVVFGAVVALCRSRDRGTQFFAFALTAVPIGAFVAMDALHGSHFSTITRYLAAGWIGIEVLVASALYAGMTVRPPIAIGAFTFLVAAGIWSAIVDNAQENWWDNNDHVAYQAIAATIDASAPHPLVLAGAFTELPLVLAPYLKAEASFLLTNDERIPQLPAGTAHAYLITPAPEVLAAVQTRERRRYRIANVSPGFANAATTFRDQLTHDPSYTAHDAVNSQRPDNALWALDLRP